MSVEIVGANLRELQRSGQCTGIAINPAIAADCGAYSVAQGRVASIDPGHPDTVAELIDIADRNNPLTRIH